MGGGLLQKINRDTQRFAFKSSAQKRDGVWYDVFKDPIDGSKSSKKGILKLIKVDGEYKTVRIDDTEYLEYKDEMVTVFENGVLVKEYDFNEVVVNSN